MSTTERLDELVANLDAQEGDFVAVIVAEEFVRSEEQEHPRQFNEWLRANAVDYCTERLKNRINYERATALRRASARLFAETSVNGEMAEALGSGLFKVRFVVDEENTRRSLATMTGEDCSFAAAAYRKTGKRHMMLGAFLDALANKTGEKTVSEVMSEEDCDRLLRSITAEDLAPELIVA
jgi:hypothetical protein